jgi:hypothetical protein
MSVLRLVTAAMMTAKMVMRADVGEDPPSMSGSTSASSPAIARASAPLLALGLRMGASGLARQEMSPPSKLDTEARALVSGSPAQPL